MIAATAIAIPALVPEVSNRPSRMRFSNDGPEGRTLAERCITYGVPDLLAGYNSYYQVIQTPDHVVIHAEKIHDARIIPLDGRPHAPAALHSWLGDSRGRWDGDTLVVETRHFTNDFRDASEQLSQHYGSDCEHGCCLLHNPPCIGRADLMG